MSFFKKDFIQNYRFKKMATVEDIEFKNSYMLKTNKCVYINLKLYFYVQRVGSIVNQLADLSKVEAWWVYQRKYQIVKNNYPELTETICNKYITILYQKLIIISKQNYDHDMSIRKGIIEILMNFNDDLYFDSIPKNIKKDLILANDSPKKLIDKIESLYLKRGTQ